ncbi:hypothetical protein [Flavobacterium daejeonense]|uniref:hypothetical protein n=1 Tax=Flavobacterium daejeonense TaxID=350893 RepID=UPI00047AFB35|nr:hypothetical protein [Flavobacterium daejeonense]
MKIKYLVLFIFFGFYSCNESKDELFLKKFLDKKDFSNQNGYNKVIDDDDLQILNRTDAINEFVFNTDKKNLFGYKTKLKNNFYLISYMTKYVPLYKPTFKILNWFDIYLCIYEKNEGVVSKIKLMSSDPILSGFEEINGVYTITSYKIKSEYDDLKKRIYYSQDSIVSKYTIENNRFVKIK